MDPSEKKKLFNCKKLMTATVCIDVHEKKSQVLEQKYENRGK